MYGADVAALQMRAGRGALFELFDVMQEAEAAAPAVAAVFFHIHQVRHAGITPGLHPVSAAFVFDGFNQKISRCIR